MHATLEIATLKKIVETKLNVSQALTHVKRVRFGNNPLGFAEDNSLLLEFPGIKQDLRYRMLVSFCDLELNNADVQRKFDRCRDLLRFDLAVLCTKKKFSADQIYTLKNMGIHILAISEAKVEGTPFEVIPDFIRAPDLDYETSLHINLLGNEISKRLRKKFHLVLSEVAADAYDEYGTFATKETMRFEDELLREALEQYVAEERKNLAIDVGCGNGRHSRLLTKYFKEVIAFDLSHRMIEAAREKDRKQLPADATPPTYYECDVEYEQFPEEEKIIGQADFVCASFGMPSFVEDTVGFLRRVYNWLNPCGRALFTFYNSQSLALDIETPWKDHGVSASIDLLHNALEVQLRDDVRFSVYCCPFDDRIRDIVETWFSIRREASFPHVMAILPPAVFGSDERPNFRARQVFASIDRNIACAKGLARGHYSFFVCEKSPAKEGLLRARKALDEARIVYEIIEHTEVVSTASVQRVLGLRPRQMVKTVIFRRTDSGKLLVALVTANDRVIVGKLAQAADCNEGDLVLAPAKDVESRFGYPVGGIAPVGYEESVPVFVDEKLYHGTGQWVYMGVGDNTCTAKMSRKMFLKLVSAYKKADLV